ncbi:SHOCT domain-containing protein [Collinsella sp. AF19-7AC]|uniref:SHOCT domain-containing protein n=1 Tax=Collinsella TaxID=102106 RepID=UPI000B7EF2FB|nr:SHOCT domain-containing protein [Collinsella aerofaciens]RGJ54135.1 SHOCT domain-containing protein [Collinsella sp. TM06-3]RGL42535.1 SHOCT domain-containing protein [Collinsella sp. TF06-6AC]RGT04663.1 SHOCT domain-containing protein [Collinsella sp. AF19-7AC]RGT30960.1 SHOCT domain-containing protein [Collinsella sp. AF19-1LB]RGW92658.1 SHOCT domain-containing protein [Collinsella sp. AF05-9]RGW93203.1 SHOCT domain-containing protein [Collinsella sp. AF05-8-2]RHD34685.1 SHOCT domain-co
MPYRRSLSGIRRFHRLLRRWRIVIDVVARLERLATLRDSGVLTEEEFAAEKAKIFL